jgi:HPt (histidine-containing phosphotransfer) domain-containing protein
MDVQMPEMDGLESTAIIRQKEIATGRHVPIIALTAHAMKGDRECCIQAGMDDYLSKPVEPSLLHQALARWAPPESIEDRKMSSDKHDPRAEDGERQEAGEFRSVPQSSITKSADTTQRPSQDDARTDVFDLAALRARVENDLELLSEMIGLYLNSSPTLLAEIESAVAARDSERITRAAHTLKGMLGNMCAGKCAEAALELETIGKSGDLAEAEECLFNLKDKLARFERVLTDVSKEVPA